MTDRDKASLYSFLLFLAVVWGLVFGIATINLMFDKDELEAELRRRTVEDMVDAHADTLTLDQRIEDIYERYGSGGVETIEEDDPRWDCETMGNRVCG